MAVDDDGTLVFYTWDSTIPNPSASSSSDAISTGKWQHVLVTREESTGTTKFYVNGEDCTGADNTCGPIPAGTTDTPLYIGARGAGGETIIECWNGKIADVVIMDKDVSADEAVDLMLQSANLATHYEYDALDRTVTEIQAPVTLPDGTACLPTTSYYYDANGNMTSMVDARRNSGEYLTESTLDSGLVGYWKMDDLNTESARDWLPGGTIYVSSGMPNVVDGIEGGALEFTGTEGWNGWFSADNLQVNTTDDGAHTTVAFWMKWDGGEAGMWDQLLFWNFNYSLVMLDDSQIGFNTGTTCVLATPTLDIADEWVHVAAVFVNGTPTGGVNANCKIYVNGISQPLSTWGEGSVASRNITNGIGLSDPYILAEDTKYNGLFDEVRVYDRELQSGEVLTLLDTENIALLEAEREAKSAYYEYDALGRKIEEVLAPVLDADANEVQPTTRYRYDEYGNLDAVADPSCSLGQWSTLYEYDNRGRAVGVEDAEGGVTSTEYDAVGNVVSSTDALGNITWLEYNSRNQVIRETSPDPDGYGPQTAPTTQYEYDDNGNLVSVTDALGNTTSYTYDALGRLTEETLPDPDGEGPSNPLESPVTAYEYDDLGNVLSITDALGNTTYYRYDALGRRTHVINANFEGTYDPEEPASTYADYLTTTEYDLLGNVVSTTNALGDTTTYEYDALGRLMKETLPDPDGAGEPLESPVTTYKYDAGGNLVGVIDALENETNYEYDALGRLTKEILPDPDVVQGSNRPTTYYGYDVLGNLTAVTDALGSELGDPDHTTRYRYDALGRQTHVIDALCSDPTAAEPDHTVLTAYDAVGNVTSVTDQLGRTTDYEYDALGRLTKETLPDPDDLEGTNRPVTSYEYDALGNLIAVTDALGNVLGATGGHTTYYRYDNLGRQTHVIDALPSSEHIDVTPINYGVAAIDGATGTGFILYSEESVHDRFDGANAPYGSNSDHFIAVKYFDNQWHYDNNGGYFSFTPEGTDQLIAEVDFDNDSITGLKGIYGIEHGIVKGYADGDLEFLADYYMGTVNDGEFTVDGTWFSIYDHVLTAYDAVGNVTSVTDQLNRTTNYEYDALGQLEKEILPDPDDPQGENRPTTYYGYDAVGNLTMVTDALGDCLGDAGHTTWYGYDALGRQTHETDALAQYSGDPGHMVITAYNAVGNVTSVTDAEGNETEYGYDFLNRLTSETDPLDNTTSYEYDDAGYLVQKTDRNGRIIAYAYDALGRLAEERWYDDEDAFDIDDRVQTITNFYDAAGQLLYVAEPTDDYYSLAYYLYEYDNLGRITKSHMAPEDMVAGNRTPDGGDMRTSTASEDWDNDGNDEAYVDHPWNFHLDDKILVRFTDAIAFEPVLIIDSPTGVRSIDINSGIDGLPYLLLDINESGTWHIHVTSKENADIGWYNFEIITCYFSISPEDLVKLDFSYDAVGNLMQVTDNHGGQTDYDYDAIGRLTQVEQSGTRVSGKKVTFNYNYDGSLASIERYGNDGAGTLSGSSQYNYDRLGRLVDLIHKDNLAADLVDYDWLYDAAGRITQMSADYTNASLDDIFSQFDYDNIDQLTSSDHTDQTDEGYTYDANGNRTGGDYETVAGSNRLQSDDTFTYQYDNEGNRTSRTRIDSITYAEDYLTEYEWDHRNRLISVTYTDNSDPTPVVTKQVEYSYDYLDRRILKRVTVDAEENDYYNAYLGDNLYLDFINPSSISIGQPENIAHRYLYGQEVDQLLAVQNVFDHLGWSNDLLWALEDHQGTVRDIMSIDGSIVEHRQYDSFGNIISAVGAQWSNDAIAWTTQYGGDWSADQATGAPDVPAYGDMEGCWASATCQSDAYNPRFQTLTLGYAAPVYAESVIIRENNVNGFVTQVEVRNAKTGDFEIVWSGTDPTPSGSLGDFEVNFTRRSYLVDAVRITIDIDTSLTEWEEIDAVQLIGSPDLPQAYTGRIWDEDVGLYDYRSRWYDASVGRFVNEDPSGFDGGDVNLYRYCNNSPIVNVDPYGLCWGGVGSSGISNGGFAGTSQNNVTTWDNITQGISFDMSGLLSQNSKPFGAATIGSSTTTLANNNFFDSWQIASMSVVADNSLYNINLNDAFAEHAVQNAYNSKVNEISSYATQLGYTRDQISSSIYAAKQEVADAWFFNGSAGERVLESMKAGYKVDNQIEQLRQYLVNDKVVAADVMHSLGVVNNWQSTIDNSLAFKSATVNVGAQTQWLHEGAIQSCWNPMELAFVAVAAPAVMATPTSSLTPSVGRSTTERLVHLTNAEAGASINSSGKLIGNIYAGPLSNAEASGLGVTLRTGLSPSTYEVAVPISKAAQGAFSTVKPIGPISGAQWLTGQQYAARGILDLSTGAFVRQGVNWNQAMIYSIDAAATGTTITTGGYYLYNTNANKK